MRKQLKAKSSKTFASLLWKFRKFTPKQIKTIQQNKKKIQTKKYSNFALQLRAKQLVAALYGKLKLQTLKQILHKSETYQGKITHSFFSLLEKRLDSCLVQVKFAPTFLAARQYINHQKVYVNHRIVTAPGFLLKPGDLITLASPIKHLVNANLQSTYSQGVQNQAQFYKPIQFEVNYKTLEAIFLFSPQQIHYPAELNPELVIKSFR